MTNLYNLEVVMEKSARFSWMLNGALDQVSYRIIVFDKMGNFVWDSSRVYSECRHGIVAPLLPEEKELNWMVEVGLEDGSVISSKGNSFITEISEWTAKWVEPIRSRKPLLDKKNHSEVRKFDKDPLERLDAPVYFRREFEVYELVEDALMYITARGIYSAYINGHKVSNVFAPGYTAYQKHIDYQVIEVSRHLKTGKNVLSFILFDGWYTGKIEYIGVGQQYGKENSLLAELKLFKNDKVIQTIITDENMRWTDKGPIRFSDLYVGEYYNQAKELTGWLDSEYIEEGWKKVAVKDYGYSELTLQSTPPIEIFREIRPQVIRTPNGDLVLDAGETIVGYTSFNQLSLTKNTLISLEHSETLDKEGNFIQNILGQNKEQKDYYVAGKNGLHNWAPEGTYHGFRFVKVEGTLDCDPEHYTINVIGTPLKTTGHFRTSDERLNKLQENIIRSQEGNMISIPTDCPQRERTGWTGDIQVYAPTACYEKDVEQFLRHWLDDMRHEQHIDGQIPQVIPCPPSHDYMKPAGEDAVNTAGWSDAAIIVPWRLYEFYGDIQILIDNYDMIRRYMKSVENRMSILPKNYEEMTPDRQYYQKYLWNTDFQFGDWLMPSVGMNSGQYTGNEVATLMTIFTTELMIKISTILGNIDIAHYYNELNKKIKMAYVNEYMTKDGRMTSDYQGVYVLALMTDTVPKEFNSTTLDRLKELLHENEDRLDTGFLSVAYLLPILHEQGEKRLANKLLFRDQSPSWLYEVKMGATTMWETWDCYAEDGTPTANSMNHFAFGCVGEYLFRTILGIDKLEPGFKKVLIKPDFNCGLHYVRGFYDSIWGRISVDWKIISDKVYIEILLPPNVSAHVVVGEMNFENIKHKFIWNGEL
ncbi:family 78 glycoside hydrolase catalytic domain [Tuanshanicoccus lijuaniae]|uniref:family 78 glycoside hydrolase catalytic domain n=1 Tax=Aerococcaceae bacterium zg-1292 TaxID=2774330 RepID=UPI001936BDF3|nr:family 78 glycoside hydrolase catalytic domain [Aerococcaceae bacterium zg-1292]QQA36872.1 family 78 glycoside hydrolase catalytic domain [Aerococcaceae bacterium zg-1292]